MKTLSHIFTVFRRELEAYFNAAIAYIFIIVFILLNGGLYMTSFFLAGVADMRPFFGLLPFILCVFLPAVTMRLWAEERRGNTLELLLTFPMGTQELVIGKFLAGLVFYIAALAATLPIPIMLKFLGAPDFGAIAGGYLGAILIGSFFLSAGIFISGLCRDQIVAFILTMIVCFGLFLAGSEFMATSIDGWIPGLGSFLRRFIGAAGHFESFAKGVADNRDILYFIGGSVIFLVLNGYWLEGRMKPGAKKIFSAAAIICAGIFLFGNWFVSSLPLGRFDLTQGKIYTVSPATKKILRELKTPVLAKYYVSPADKMPTGMKTIEQDVVDKLDELRVSSGGNFDYKIFHMEAANVADPQEKPGTPDSLEKQLEKKGIQPFQVKAIESDEVAVRLVYSAITLAYKEKPEEMLPRVIPDNLNELEYLIISRVYRMTLDATPKIAMIAPYQEKSIDPQLKALLAQLGGKAQESYKDDNYELAQQAIESEGYEVARIDLSENQPVPEGTKTLIIFEPKEFNDRQKYELNRFLRGGGSILLCVQDFIYNYQTEGRSLQIQTQKNNPGLNTLLQSWGVEVDENILVDPQSDVITLNAASQVGPFAVAVPVKIPIQIIVNEDGMNPDVSVTSRIASLFYLWGTALKIDEAKIKSQNLKIETLFHSSRDSWTVPFPEGVLTPNQLGRQMGSRNGSFPLAALIQGQFADAYEGQPLPQWPAKKTNAAVPAEKPAGVTPPAVTPAPGKLILIGASTPFQKNLIRGGGHLNFLINSVDVLTLGDALVTIRSKQPVDRSIKRISAPVKVAWKGFVIFLVPFLLAGLGTARVLIRRRAKTNYLKTLAFMSEAR